MAKGINQEDLKEFYNKGVLAFEKKNYEYAIDIFSQILSSKYDHLEARHYLHLALKNKIGERHTSSISTMINSINKSITAFLTERLVKQGKIGEAIERFEKIYARDPKDTEVLKKIAEIFYQQSLISHALQNLEDAKSINPNDIEILKKLGEIYLKKEDYKNAKANYELVLKINPNSTEALKSLKNLDALGTIQREFKEPLGSVN